MTEEQIVEPEIEVAPIDLTQHMLLSYLITNPSLWVKGSSLIKEEYFAREYRPLITFVREYLSDYKNMPSHGVIHAKTKVKLDVPLDSKEESTERFICNELERFSQSQAFVNWLYDAGDQIVKDNSQRSIASMIKESKAIADMSLRRDMGFEIHDATKEVLERARDNLNISTGYQLLDAALGGGLIRPSFNIISASSGDGKSIFLQNIAINFMQKGENVVFYTLELEPFIVQQRFAAMMTNTDIGLIMNYLTDVDNEMRMRIDTHGDGLCYVVKFPMVGTTIADIEAHYKDLIAETGLEFSAICVDYLDVMQPIRKVDMSDIHNKDRLLSEEFNDFLHDTNLIGFTASQQVKGAQDEKDARQSGVSGGREKVSTADNLWIAKRSMEDKENERWWIHIKKMRSGGGNNVKVPFNWNSKTQRITDGPFELFEKTNPFFYGRKQAATPDTNPRLANDSIVQSSGVLEELSKPEDDTMEAKKKKSSDVMHRIMGEIGKERI